MTTPQEIREKSFDKARSMFGGYDMVAIDDYLDELANDFEALQKENAVLKGKMKVLVDKIEEYRNNESALNMAILSAQKLSVQIENDARARAQTIVSEAEAKASALLGGIDERIALEESRLQAAKLSSAKFFDSVREMCQKQLDTLDTISAASRLGSDKAAEAIRIPAEPAAPTPAPADAGNTQVFSFIKDEI